MTTVPPAALGTIVWLAGKLVLVGLLVLMHWGRQRFRSVPAPLFERRAPVRGSTRLFEGIVGTVAGYALCAATFFASMVNEPTGTTLGLIPADDSPAEQAGLLPGDLARSVEGTAVKDFEEFRQAIERAPESVSIEVERKGRAVPLTIRKDEENRIGVMPVPGPPMGAAAALPRAVASPALFLAAWVSATVRAVAGEATEMVGFGAVGIAASESGVAWARVLALLMTQSLILITIIHVVILAADARSRARYQASTPPLTEERASP